MTAPEASIALSAVSGTLDQLVHQFADPMAFLRELLQNSIDAGSSIVEVRCELRQDGGAQGVLIISVDDWGEGMTRQIIDSRLTRLFSSDKAGDRTKIGKFGIGFVSVFGIQPDAVCVDTARGGERWRVLFRGDRSFTRVRLDDPIEGTKVRVIKNIDAKSYPEYEHRVRAALTFWCQHVEIELRYQGERIDKPLCLDTPVEVRDDGPLGVVCVGIATDGSAGRAGFYNRGLALLERSSEWAGLSYKVNSPRLAHTLARDQVIKDEAYYPLVARVEALRPALLQAVLERLEELLRADALIGEWEPLQKWLLEQLEAGVTLPETALDRSVARAPQGQLLSYATCRKAAAAQQLVVAAQPSPLTEVLEAQGYVVILQEGRSESIARRLLGQTPLRIEKSLFMPLPLSDRSAEATWLPLSKAVQSLLLAHDRQPVAVRLGQFAYPGSSGAGLVAAVEAKPYSISYIDNARRPRRGAGWDGTSLVLNVDHPTVQKLRGAAYREPEWAAYTLLKLFHLGIDLTAQLDGVLLQAATEQRAARKGP